MDHTSIYFVQFLFVFGVTCGSRSLNIEDAPKWMAIVARYLIYILLINGTDEACKIIYKSVKFHRQIDLYGEMENNKRTLFLFLSAVAILVSSKQNIMNEDFLFLFIAYLLSRNPNKENSMNTSKTINYGVGMACSFFEGYLTLIIPSDGAHFIGFEENIQKYESNNQGIKFPLRKLFIIVTKSLYCPPNLSEFKRKENGPYLEACKSLDDVKRSVAGVTNRVYRNSAYKIHRPRERDCVYLAAECATPVHTLYKVTRNTALYHSVLAGVDTAELVEDFIATLRMIIERSPECRGKCEVVFFDDTDPKLSLAEVLLDKIREIEPNFETIMKQNEILK